MNIFTKIALAFLAFFVMVSPVMAKEKEAGNSGQLTLATTVKVEDMRVRKLQIYLEKNHSPLADHAEYFVKTADKYGLGEDWSMVAAIAGVESTFGKFTPKSSYNAWGWGIPTGAKSGVGFKNWDDGIETVTAGLKTNYIDKEADTLPKMQHIYAPPSRTWAHNVRFFMDKIEDTEVPTELALSI